MKGEAEQHGHDVEGERAEHVEAELGRDPEDQGEDAVRRQLHREADHQHHRVAHTLEEPEDGPRPVARHQRERDAEDQGEEDEPEHVALGGGLDRVPRDDIGEGLDAEPGLLRLDQPLAGLGRVLGHQPVPDLGADLVAGPDHVHQREAQRRRERRRAEEEGQRLGADPADPADVAQ